MEGYNISSQNQQGKENDRLAFEIKRALLDDTPAPNANKAYKDFLKRNHLVPKKKPLWIGISALAAACIALILLFLPWHTIRQTEEYAKNHKQLAQMGNIVYETNNERPYVTLRTNNKTIVLDSKANTQKAGIIIMPDNEIRVFDIDRDNHEPVTLSVPAGKNAKILLSDGTKVKLNAGSNITFPRSFRESGIREVELEGEAYFEVNHDESHPFMVKTNTIRTKVLGTEFNVRSFKDERAKVTLIEGCVSVESKDKQVYLQPQQAAQITPDGDLHVTETDADETLSWLHGEFYFDGQSLREIMTEIGRWYNLNIVFANDQHLEEQLHFSANRSASVSEIIRQLQLISDMHIELKQKEQVLLVK